MQWFWTTCPYFHLYFCSHASFFRRHSAAMPTPLASTKRIPKSVETVHGILRSGVVRRAIRRSIAPAQVIPMGKNRSGLLIAEATHACLSIDWYTGVDTRRSPDVSWIRRNGSGDPAKELSMFGALLRPATATAGNTRSSTRCVDYTVDALSWVTLLMRRDMRLFS